MFHNRIECSRESAVNWSPLFHGVIRIYLLTPGKMGPSSFTIITTPPSFIIFFLLVDFLYSRFYICSCGDLEIKPIFEHWATGRMWESKALEKELLHK